MATFNWSTLTNNQSITFNPALDILNIDDATIAAAGVSASFTNSNSGTVTLTLAGKTVTLSTPLTTLTTTNVVFANGSQMLIGDNTTAVGGAGANDDAANTSTGTVGDDAFLGLGGNDTLNGGDGNDSFYAAFGTAALGNDSIDGGNGFDSVIYNNNSILAIGVNLSGVLASGIAAHTATNSQGTHSLTSIETVLGTAVADTFIGGDAAHGVDSQGNTTTERFRGNAGNDTIIGGADTLTGVNTGNGFFTVADYANNSAAQGITANLQTGVVLDGRGGTDSLTNVDGLRGGAGVDLLTGGSLSRTASGYFFEFFRGNAGNDVLNGNNGFSDSTGASVDRADYSSNGVTQAISVDLVNGTVVDGLGGVDTLIDIDQVYGGAGNDTMTGGAANDSFDGGAGNDTINGGAGQNEVRFSQSTAGAIVNLSASSLTVGAITVLAGTANDGMGGTDSVSNVVTVTGSSFDDYLRGSDDVNVQEFFRGYVGNDTIDGGAGIDFASYANNAVLLGGVTAFIESGAGTVSDGTGGTDTLINIEGLTGTNVADSLSGGAGTQWFRGNGGNDTINGGAGIDWVTHRSDPTGVGVFLLAGTAEDGMNGTGGLLGLGGTDTLISIENVEGSEFADILVGDLGNNTIEGLDGNDNLSGWFGTDVINGGAGAADTYSTAFVETSLNITGVAGNYTFTSIVNGDVVTVTNVEQYELAGVVTAAPVNIVYTPFGGATAAGEVIITGATNDQIDGLGGSDQIYSQDGNDQVTGGLGNDIIVLGAGRDTGLGGDDNDYIYGGDDADVLSGGGGVDILAGDAGNDVLLGGGDTDYVYGGAGTNILFGDAGVDALYAQGTDDVMYGGAEGDYFYPFPGAVTPVAFGGEGNDIYTDLSGGAGSDDTFYGENGHDYFYGFGGNDTMFAGEGVDVFAGGNGNDVFDGGTGTDYAWGEAGNDTFVTSASNGYLLINDFTAGGTEDALHLVGTNFTTFAQVQGALSYYAGINTTILTIDADTNVWLVGVTIPSLTADDFVFL